MEKIKKALLYTYAIICVVCAIGGAIFLFSTHKTIPTIFGCGILTLLASYVYAIVTDLDNDGEGDK